MASIPDDERLLPKHFAKAEGTEDWRLLGEGACTFIPTDSFEQSVRLIDALTKLPALVDNPPDIDVRRDGVTIRVITAADNWFGPSKKDVERARQISAAVRDLGLTPDPLRAQTVLIIPGAPDIKAIMPFWQAVLGYRPRPDSPDEDLVDPGDRSPAFWFEKMNEPRAGRRRSDPSRDLGRPRRSAAPHRCRASRRRPHGPRQLRPRLVDPRRPRRQRSRHRDSATARLAKPKSSGGSFSSAQSNSSTSTISASSSPLRRGPVPAIMPS